MNHNHIAIVPATDKYFLKNNFHNLVLGPLNLLSQLNWTLIETYKKY